MTRCCSKVSNNFWWAVNRSREIYRKIHELPYYLLHPSAIISILYQFRVKDAMANQKARRIEKNLSKIAPSHPLNWYAENKRKERVAVLQKHKAELDLLLRKNQPVSQSFTHKLMPSTDPIQCVFDRDKDRYIAFNGSGRILALKAFFGERDPKIEIEIFLVPPHLFKNAVTYQFNS